MCGSNQRVPQQDRALVLCAAGGLPTPRPGTGWSGNSWTSEEEFGLLRQKWVTQKPWDTERSFEEASRGNLESCYSTWGFWPSASASFRNHWKIQNLSPYPDLVNPNLLGLTNPNKFKFVEICISTKSPGDSYAITNWQALLWWSFFTSAVITGKEASRYSRE